MLFNVVEDISQRCSKTKLAPAQVAQVSHETNNSYAAILDQLRKEVRS